MSWARQLALYGGEDFALAVAPNGGYDKDSAGLSQGIYITRRKVLAQCKKKCKSSACKIMDVNGTSAFIKQRGSSSSSSTASSSNYVWCATSKQAWRTTVHSCKSSKGKDFSLKHQAESEHQRLKKTTTISVASTKYWAFASYFEFVRSFT